MRSSPSSQGDWAERSRNPFLSTSPALGLQTCSTTPDLFQRGSWGFRSGPLVCKASTLPTKPSLQCSNMHLLNIQSHFTLLIAFHRVREALTDEIYASELTSDEDRAKIQLKSCITLRQYSLSYLLFTTSHSRHINAENISLLFHFLVYNFKRQKT